MRTNNTWKSLNYRTPGEYIESKLHRLRWFVRQFTSRAYRRNHVRRIGARLGFYTAWLEDDFRNPYPTVNGIGWTWNPIPQWRRNADVIALLKERAAAAKAEDFLRHAATTSRLRY